MSEILQNHEIFEKNNLQNSIIIKYLPIVDLLYFGQVGILVESVDFESEH